MEMPQAHQQGQTHSTCLLLQTTLVMKAWPTRRKTTPRLKSPRRANDTAMCCPSSPRPLMSITPTAGYPPNFVPRWTTFPPETAGISDFSFKEKEEHQRRYSYVRSHFNSDKGLDQLFAVKAPCPAEIQAPRSPPEVTAPSPPLPLHRGPAVSPPASFVSLLWMEAKVAT